MKEKFTRADYMRNPGLQAHRTYYRQFVTPAVIDYVKRAIGEDRILASRDPYFNDIPLVQWDRMERALCALCIDRMGEINGTIERGPGVVPGVAWSLSDAVCIAKEAARQICEARGSRAFT